MYPFVRLIQEVKTTLLLCSSQLVSSLFKQEDPTEARGVKAMV